MTVNDAPTLMSANCMNIIVIKMQLVRTMLDRIRANVITDIKVSKYVVHILMLIMLFNM